MGKLPPLAARAAGTAAFNTVALTKVVVSAVLFHQITLPFTNPLPLICRLNALEPAGTLVGEIVVITGGAAAGVEGVLGEAGLVVPASVPPPQPERQDTRTKASRITSARI
jgi:hypothetical protein